MTDYTIKDSYIVNHHLERDRSEVTAAFTSFTKEEMPK